MRSSNGRRQVAAGPEGSAEEFPVEEIPPEELPAFEGPVAVAPVVSLANRLAAANIAGRMAGWTFASFPAHAGAVRGLGTAKEYATTRTPQPPGLLLVGPTGVGKTGLAVAIARERIEQGDGNVWAWELATSGMRAARPGECRQQPAPVWMESWMALLGRLHRGMFGWNADQGELLEELTGDRVALLVVDEIGVAPPSAWREGVMLEILERPARGQRLVLTANLPPSGLVPVIGERAADRLCDRETFRVVEVGGSSLRQRGGPGDAARGARGRR